jgi:hypothetical protein
METMNRAIILDLGPLLLKVWDAPLDPEHGILMNFYSIQLSYLTHTSIQMYKRSLWESSICVVEREVSYGVLIVTNSALIMMFRLVDSVLHLR